jgi:hypothetical protein
MPSSVIRDIAYDSERTELKVSFVSGKVYIYALVPAAVAAALANADAKGCLLQRACARSLSLP